MIPVNDIQRTSIVKRIDFIETELNDLDEYKELDFERSLLFQKSEAGIRRCIVVWIHPLV